MVKRNSVVHLWCKKTSIENSDDKLRLIMFNYCHLWICERLTVSQLYQPTLEFCSRCWAFAIRSLSKHQTPRSTLTQSSGNLCCGYGGRGGWGQNRSHPPKSSNVRSKSGWTANPRRFENIFSANLSWEPSPFAGVRWYIHTLGECEQYLNCNYMLSFFEQ